MKILVTGGTGLLGSELVELMREEENIDLYVPSRNIFDLLNFASMQTFFQDVKPDIVIHCAALTKEKMKGKYNQEIFAVNCKSSFDICKIANSVGSELIYISTDYVFDGMQGNYIEDNAPNPKDYYSFTKVYSEGIFLAYNYRVIRTSFCAKVWPYEFAFKDKWASRDTVDIIAKLIKDVSLNYNRWKGILHVGTDKKSFYDLAVKIKPDVKQNSCLECPNVPIDTSFDLTKLKGILDELQSKPN